MICSVMVVLPEDSGPKISITRPRGTPPTPSAASNEMEPVEITEIGTMASFAPSRMIDPLPNCFSSCESAVSMALLRSSATAVNLLYCHASCSGWGSKASLAPEPVHGKRKAKPGEPWDVLRRVREQRLENRDQVPGSRF